MSLGTTRALSPPPTLSVHSLSSWKKLYHVGEVRSSLLSLASNPSSPHLGDLNSGFAASSPAAFPDTSDAAAVAARNARAEWRRPRRHAAALYGCYQRWPAGYVAAVGSCCRAIRGFI